MKTPRPKKPSPRKKPSAAHALKARTASDLLDGRRFIAAEITDAIGPGSAQKQQPAGPTGEDKSSRHPAKVIIESMEPFGPKGVTLCLSMRFGEGRNGAVPAGFDPWTASFGIGEILANQGSPAIAQWAAACGITERRAEAEAGGEALLDAIAVVARHGLVMPDWLAQAYLTRYIRFQRKELATLDEAFEHDPADLRTLQAAQRHRRLIPIVAELARDAINADPARPLDRGFFDEIAEQIVARGDVESISGSQVDKLYRDGVRDGEQDLVKLKKLMRRKTNSSE